MAPQICHHPLLCLSLLILHFVAAMSRPNCLSADCLSTSSAPNADEPLPESVCSAESVCQKTDFPELCSASVQPFMPSKGSCDAATVLGAEVKASVQKVVMAQSLVKDFFKDPKSFFTIFESLKICITSYLDAFGHLKEILDDISDKQYFKLIEPVSEVLKDYQRCRDAFSEDGVTPLGDMNDELHKLATNCLAIAKEIRP
ncbi:hypothetical protein AMTRI_Chr02g223590 [Amborella trichopoda]|uniref:Pectinesterase inhibitor domain-containing protein n=1 Tax=Amborella trichopoda TaxID=13333 RepID=W1P2G2_AMBTC|nr:uncharacterized protein LOC18430206 [Amborella trichopoda]ERN02103.1 hypothetical protein AMTR_s00045p00160990 [Amborella trichopoda]|eukprot:XP_006840428.1 uncharacterized protein LOC18430206 [Amborella trichopoda]